MKQHFEENKWLYNNIIPIITTFILWAVSFGVLTTKVDQVIKLQDSFTMEVRDWRRQYEQRLGQVEVDVKVFAERQDQVRTVLKLK